LTALFQPSNRLLCGRWIDCHFSSAPVFEKWSKAKMTFLLCVVEKALDGLFQHNCQTGYKSICLTPLY